MYKPQAAGELLEYRQSDGDDPVLVEYVGNQMTYGDDRVFECEIVHGSERARYYLPAENLRQRRLAVIRK